jgi:prepilin-type N-terminal cleavage/methylation domain-containing protein
MKRMSAQHGFTLIELVITLLLLGFVASVTTLALRKIDETPPEDPVRVLSDSLRRAVADGRAITVRLVVRGAPALATIHPDGSIVADSIANVDRLAGATRAP